VTSNGTPARSFTYDRAGNILTDTKGGVTTTYSYNHAGRLASLTVGGSGRGPYRTNGFGLLASRQMTAGVPASTVHLIYDFDGNLIAEADASTGLTRREYVWFAGRPLAVFDRVDSGSPSFFSVHVDHLDRPVMMTNRDRTAVWRASYLPFGEVRSISGWATLDARFPGQWFMAEVGLAYNWHRWYDATLGRYTQPDPLGMPDGPNRYLYALGSPLMYVDPDGQQSRPIPGLPPLPLPWPVGSPENRAITKWCRGVLESVASLFLPGTDDEGCDEEWAEARETCARELKKPNPNRRLTGGYRDIEQCARGLVSERCGGNPIYKGE